MPTTTTRKWMSVLRFFGSLWFGAVVLMAILLGLACATVFESTHGTEQALAFFYMSPWFHGLLAILGISVLIALVTRFSFQRAKIGFALTHGSILLILVGATITRRFGIDGQLALMEGEASSELRLSGLETIKFISSGGPAAPSINLPASMSSGLVAVDVPAIAGATVNGAEVNVSRYLPDSEAQSNMHNDAAHARLAVEIALSRDGGEESAWIFAGESARLGDVPVALTLAADDTDLARRLAETGETGASIGTIKARVSESEVELSAEACLREAVPVGDTGFSVKVLEYFPHARVGSGGAVTNQSSQPVNPAVRVEVTGPAGTSTRLLFAKFPEFGATHGDVGSSALSLAFVASGKPASAAAPVEIISTPSAGMAVRFRSGESARTHQIVQLAEPVATPWPELQLTVLRRFDRARMVERLEQPERIRESRIPAVLLTFKNPEGTTELWVQKHLPRRVMIGSTAYEAQFVDQTLPLGFSIALNKFTVGYYPGGRRPRSFESQITINDPSAGAAMNRLVNMNHPTSHGGFTFYQSSYQLSGSKAMSVLSVARDPGMPVVFAGYVGLMAGMLWVLVARMRARGHLTGSHANGIRTNQGAAKIDLLANRQGCMNDTTWATSTRSGGEAVPAANGPHKARIPSESSPMTSRSACLLGFLCVASAASAADLPTTLDVGMLRGVVTQHDGRWPPLDTVARDFVHAVTGQTRFRNADPVLVLLGWTFEPAAWSREALISIRNAELRREIGLPADQTIFSFSELVAHERLRSLIDDLSRMESGRKPDPLQKKVSDIHEKLIQLQMVFRGQAIRLIPSPTDPLAAWEPIPESPGANPDELTAAWNALRAAYIARDEAAFAAASLRVAQASASSPAAFRPLAKVTAAELRYNRLAPYATAWKLLLTGATLAAVAAFVRRRAFDALAAAVILGGFGVLTYGLSLRWQIAGRIPASNMFESLLFLSWGMAAFAILAVFLFRHRLVPLTAAGMSAVSLVLADKLPVDQFVRPIAPVLLDTVWMSIHVPIIMVSYSVLALAVLVAHLQLVTMALAPRKVTWSGTLDGLHYGYVHVGSILLTVGIITGSMWAASSWGRYWGWDPKEVWSLVALLGYMTILHVRIDHDRIPAWGHAVGLLLLLAAFAVVLTRLEPVTGAKTIALLGALAAVVFMVLGRGPFATAAKSILCFWLIIMTYVGVNFVLGIGLHSYGFGTGAVARYMFLLGGADLAFVALCALVYLARNKGKAVAGSPLGQAAMA